ncbi:choice-of-anchor P family protein [Lentzea albidocapillata]|uniref:von Willebrand factor type A domain-containing protein n=1 Tax=Lentzea albidocapillata TaxID=40571 RepID=A0A1W2CH47_9PSEU|nr:choice-of-anchor P family protein [Lentzea albidocapillata]SMC83948.1 von Willebrand factor type A domain-containing protein [Lentzea albidocapillata]
MRPSITVGAALAATVALAIPAHAATGNLPGGTSIGVTITGPANNTVVVPGPVTVTGQASIGTGVAVVDTALTYVLDVSGSTQAGVTAGCGGDQNGDGQPATILDCEIAAARSLNTKAAAPNTVVGSVGAAVFGSLGAPLDVSPDAGDQKVVAPTADANGNGTSDISEALGGVQFGGAQLFTARSVGGGTNYTEGLTAGLASATAAPQQRKLMIFLSDGAGSGAVDALLQQANDAGIKIFTFAVSNGVACGLASAPNSLRKIAETTGGTCTEVPDVSQLPDVVPGVIASKLTQLTLKVDEGADLPITSIAPALPQDGPANVDYTVDTPALTAGTHKLCVTARGTDGGGAGDVTECVTVKVNAPPVVKAGGPYAGQEGTGVGLAGLVTDPDGPSLTTAWTATPQSGVDAGATCSFGNAAAQTTTVKCTDDGVWELKLTANDGVNPPVTATTTLTLSNLAPQTTLSANNTLVTRGTTVNFTAPFTDIATNDKHTCTFDFDDGSPVVNGAVAQGAGSGTCTGSRTFTALGAHNVLVRVTDDDGASATAVVKVVVYLRGEAWALGATGLITIAKTPHAQCPPNEDKTVASVNVLGLASVNALHADCTLDANTGRTVASARVEGASLLGGAIKLNAIEAKCVSDANGVTGSSKVGTLNGQPIGTGPATVGIPGVATVHLNETTTGPNGRLIQNAVRVRTLLGQEIILSACRLG